MPVIYLSLHAKNYQFHRRLELKCKAVEVILYDNKFIFDALPGVYLGQSMLDTNPSTIEESLFFNLYNPFTSLTFNNDFTCPLNIHELCSIITTTIRTWLHVILFSYSLLILDWYPGIVRSGFVSECNCCGTSTMSVGSIYSFSPVSPELLPIGAATETSSSKNNCYF